MEHHLVYRSLVFIFLLQNVKGYKYLLVGITQVSHIFEISNIGGQLVKNGHEVVLPLPHDFPKNTAKVVQDKGIDIWTLTVPENARLTYKTEMADALEQTAVTGKVDMQIGIEFAHNDCLYFMNDTALLAKLKAKKFDMAVVDAFPLARCTPLVPHYLGIPWVSETTLNEPYITKTPLLPSVFPSAFMETTDDMTFVERCMNMVVNVIFVANPLLKNDTLLKRFVNDPTIRTWNDLGQKAELYIITRDYLLQYPEPSMPNVIYIGGTTAQPAKPLSKDILSFVEGSVDVVLVSFGSILQNSPKAINKKFMNVFKNRKEKIIWNFRGQESDFETIPSNVKLLKWIPQNDLLGHANVKLFITHGGNNGRYESMYHGVPMIVFPIFAEQPYNAKFVSSRRLGLQMNIRQFTEDELTSAMDEVLGNPEYTKNIKKRSAIMKSRPMTELERAAWWIEHVTQFGGDHLRSHSFFMPWYKLYMVDMMLVALLISITILVIVRSCLKCVFHTLMGSSKKEKLS